MQKSVLIFITREVNNATQVLLGKRKSEYAKNKWNGLGGKVEKDETNTQAAVREVAEESGIELKESKLKKVAEIEYIEPGGNWEVVAYTVNKYAEEEPIETEEILPKWFEIKELPLNKMWDNDKLWVPRILNGEKLKGTIENDENDMLVEANIYELSDD